MKKTTLPLLVLASAFTLSAYAESPSRFAPAHAAIQNEIGTGFSGWTGETVNSGYPCSVLVQDDATSGTTKITVSGDHLSDPNQYGVALPNSTTLTMYVTQDHNLQPHDGLSTLNSSSPGRTIFYQIETRKYIAPTGRQRRGSSDDRILTISKGFLGSGSTAQYLSSVGIDYQSGNRANSDEVESLSRTASVNCYNLNATAPSDIHPPAQ